MILTCPSCGTQYVVKDGAIPDGGRQVRCAACKHSWHQDPEPLELTAEEASREPGEAPAADESIAASDSGHAVTEAEAAPDDGNAVSEQPPGYAAVDPVAPPSDPLAEEEAPGAYAAEEERGFDQAPAVDSDEWRPPERDDEFSPFAERDAIGEERRSPLRGVLVALLILALLAAALWFLAPGEWKARVGIADAGETPLQLMMTHSDRQRLASGNELLAVTGRVINPTDESQPVPPIRAQLRSRSGELVYSWTIAPPAPRLGPGASATFNSAEVNVPAGGDELTISLGAPRA